MGNFSQPLWRLSNDTRPPCKHLLWSPSTSTSWRPSFDVQGWYDGMIVTRVNPDTCGQKIDFLLKVFLVFMSLLLEGLSGKRVEQVWRPMMLWSYDGDMYVICDMCIMYIHINYTLQTYIAGYCSIISFDDLTLVALGFPGLSAAAPWFGHDPQTLRGTGGGGTKSGGWNQRLVVFNAPINESIINQSNWLIILLHH